MQIEEETRAGISIVIQCNPRTKGRAAGSLYGAMACIGYLMNFYCNQLTFGIFLDDQLYMAEISKPQCSAHGWLDSLAISMSVICAIHCLLTPLLVILFPILTTTFWVHQDFHLWMLFFVLPTTSLAVFLGCRKHKDKFVAGLSAAGLTCLFAVSLYECFFHANPLLQHSSECMQCLGGGIKTHFTATMFVNVFGGVLLASAHIRNYRLCRSSHCSHDS